MKSSAKIILLGLLALFGLFFVYKNHFDNPFELDDSHTIANNGAIRNLSIGKFFSDATTFSALPANQAYRPGLTTINAIDYAIWSKSNQENPLPLWFHVSIFITYCILCVALYFFYSFFFQYAFPNNSWNPFFALTSSVFFAFHTANAETVNYIIQRAEIYSTLAVIIAFLIFLYSKKRNLYLFLIPVVIGFFIKEPTIMFAPLLFVFVFLFEDNLPLVSSNIFDFKKWKNPLRWSGAALALGIFLILFAKKQTPPNWTSGSENIAAFSYLLTNFYSVSHYIFNFFLPFNLSVDTDVRVFDNFFDDRIIAGGVLIVSLLILASFLSKKKETRPAAFGILWFFITLIPTSTIFPFAEPLNDHRPFFGYIGLVLAVVNLISLALVKWQAQQKKYSSYLMLSAVGALLFISAHAYGTYHRTEVWGSEETLWKDATVKCPQSGRIWMNYGLTLMRRGEYNGAYEAYTNALRYAPYYSYLYINFGILKNAMGKVKEAEADYLTGIRYGPDKPDSYKFYGDYLLKSNRVKVADSICSIGLSISPNNIGLLELKSRIENFTPPVQITVPVMEQKVKESPSKENWINLSLARYNAGDYLGCVQAAEEVLKIDSQNLAAYNNICAAYNMLQLWEKAAAAGRKGLEFHPNNQLLRNNLQVSLDHLK